MKSTISITFKKINGQKVDGKLLKENPALFITTYKTIDILCKQIEKYFKNHKIEVETTYELKKW